jgi:hypothetical protein
MARLLARSLLIAVLLGGLSVPALAVGADQASGDGAMLAAGTDRDDRDDGKYRTYRNGTIRISRDAQIGPEDGRAKGTRGMTRNDDGNARVLNEGTYRARATDDGMDWSWLGLLGLIGLAGLMRGDNRNRNRT